MQTPRHLAAFIGGLAVAACSGRAGAPPPASHPAPGAVATVDAAPSDPLDAAAILADVAWLTDDARAGRGSLSPEAQATATWLEGQLRAAGLEVSTQDVPSAPGQHNVVAIYRPPHPDDARAILLIAHYDHLGVQDGAIYHGADDNASGVAVLLAIARDLGARRDLARPVVFLFPAAEELGLYGSVAYAAEPRWPLADTRLVINLDMVGRRFYELAVDRDAAVGAVGLDDDPVVAAAAERAADAAGLALVKVSPAILRAIGEGFRGDDWSLRRPGLPAVHFSTSLHADYHQPTDTIDKLSGPQLTRVAHLVRNLLHELDP